MKMMISVLVLAMSFAAAVTADDGAKKGHGAGGVRADHASEMGMEKGKAWAGSREKEDKEEKPKKEKKEKKQKKEKQNKSKGKNKDKSAR